MMRLAPSPGSRVLCIQALALLAHVVVPAFAFSGASQCPGNDLRGTLIQANLQYDSVDTYNSGDLLNSPMSLAAANGNIFILNGVNGVTLVRFASSTSVETEKVDIAQFTKGKTISSLLPAQSRSSISSFVDVTGANGTLYLLPLVTIDSTSFPIPVISLPSGTIPLPCQPAGSSSCKTPFPGSLQVPNDLADTITLNPTWVDEYEKCGTEWAHPIDLAVDPNGSGNLFLLNQEPQNADKCVPKPSKSFPVIAKISGSNLTALVQGVQNCTPEDGPPEGQQGLGSCTKAQRTAWYLGGNSNPGHMVAASNGKIYVVQDCGKCALMRSEENDEDIPVIEVDIATGEARPFVTSGVEYFKKPQAVAYDPDTNNVYVVQDDPPDQRAYVVQVTPDGVATPFLVDAADASAPTDIVYTENGLFVVSSSNTISFIKPCCGSACPSGLTTGQVAGIAVGVLCALGVAGWLFCSFKGKRRRGGFRASNHLSEPLLTPQLNSFLNDASAANKWAIGYNDLTLDRVVGTGSWGRVYAGQFHGSRVAIKELMGFRDENGNVSRDDKAQRALEDFKKECLILMGLHHAAVIEFFGLSEAPTGMLYIVTEYCDTDIGKLLQTGLREKKYVGFHDRLTWHDICNQLCSGMRYLHAQGIIHRDLKPDNVLLTRGAPWSVASEGSSTKRGSRRSRSTINGLRRVTDDRFVAKICDFGISKQMDHSAQNPLSATHTRAAGTPLYMSPEVMIGEQKEAHYSYKADVYSFAVVLWTMWCGDEPFRDVQGNLLALMMAITRGRRPALDPKFQWPPNVVALLERCWTHNPEERPSFDELQSKGMLSPEVLFPSKASARVSVPGGGAGSIQGGGVGGLARAHKSNFDLNTYAAADNA